MQADLSMKAMEIRHAKPEDLESICDVHRQAFGGRDEEARLVEMLYTAGKVPLSFVAVLDGQIVAHVLFSPVTLEPPDAGFHAVGMAPVGVVPAYQNRGIGSRLIREGLQACREAGYDTVVVLGDPAYYGRFGFRRALDHGLGNEYGAEEAFMVLPLREGEGRCFAGTVKYAPEFRGAGC